MLRIDLFNFIAHNDPRQSTTMFGRKKSKAAKSDNSYLSIDIGTEFVKVLLFEIVEEEIQILGYAKKKQKLTSMHQATIVDLDSVTDSVDVTIGEAISKAEDQTGNNFFPKSAIVGIAGELVRGVSIEVEVDREKPNKSINQKEIDKVMNSVAEYAFTHAIEDISKDVLIDKDSLVELDLNINSMYIDGKKTKSPIGLSGNILLFKVFSTFAPKFHFEAIEKVLKNLKLKLEKVVVQPYAVAVGVEGMKQNTRSGIFIDIGGGTTDIALVIHGDIVGTKMFPIGGRAFTKKIAQSFGVSYEEAEQLKIDYTLDKLMKGDVNKLRDAIQNEVEVWIESVEVALSEFTEIEDFPVNIYLCGGGSLLVDIRTAIIEYPWPSVLPFKTFPRIELLLPNKIADVVDTTRSVNDASDVTPLALARMILEK